MNTVPRNYRRITAEVLIETSHDQPGDVIHVFKNLNGHLAFNLRTGKYAYVFPAMLRDPACVRFTEVLR